MPCDGHPIVETRATRPDWIRPAYTRSGRPELTSFLFPNGGLTSRNTPTMSKRSHHSVRPVSGTAASPAFLGASPRRCSRRRAACYWRELAAICLVAASGEAGFQPRRVRSAALAIARLPPNNGASSSTIRASDLSIAMSTIDDALALSPPDSRRHVGLVKPTLVLGARDLMDDVARRR